jgi:hypothetical protein
MDANLLPDSFCDTNFTQPDKRRQEVVPQMDANFFSFLERPTYLKKARSGGNVKKGENFAALASPHPLIKPGKLREDGAANEITCVHLRHCRCFASPIKMKNSYEIT